MFYNFLYNAKQTTKQVHFAWNYITSMLAFVNISTIIGKCLHHTQMSTPLALYGEDYSACLNGAGVKVYSYRFI